jgi:hypothetical protein
MLAAAICHIARLPVATAEIGESDLHQGSMSITASSFFNPFKYWNSSKILKNLRAVMAKICSSVNPSFIVPI